MLLAAHLRNKNGTNMQPILDEGRFSYGSEQQPGSRFHLITASHQDYRKTVDDRSKLR